MCGISGFISKNRITSDQLKRMNDTMIHRGPDDSGVEIYEGKNGYCIGLAQRRLSILDLSELGHQPMHSQAYEGSEASRVSVVYNGEIYNYRELKEEIKDYPFKSSCDTELLIAAYLKWGKACFERFNGMFAVAIYDRENDEVIFARDRIGKKPLYYYLKDDELIFASELKPIMAYDRFEKKINEKILPRYISQQYIAEPDTIFENVYKLEPGTILTFKEGRIDKEKFWDISKVYKKNSERLITDYAEAKDMLKDLLIKSVKRRMISDVPLGTFLSGGYDSSLITAIAASISDIPVKTFTIGFGDKEYNEAGYASEVAGYLKTDHTEKYITEKDMFDLVESLPVYFDEPMADSSQIPTMLVSGLAKERVTVALSGDGGDEFYCGYNIYKHVLQAQKLDGIGRMADNVFRFSHFDRSGAYEKLPFKVRLITENRNALTKTQLSSMEYAKAATQMVLNKDALPCKYETENRYETDNWQIKRMLLDMDTYLPGDILFKVDRASMKYSLESRCPILDKDVMEFSFRIPHEFKYMSGDKKHILKDIAHDYIPEKLLNRPKRGFRVPLDKWMRGPLKEKLTDYSEAGFLQSQGLFEQQKVGEIVNRYLTVGDSGPLSGNNFSKICWAYLVFQQWYEYYFK